jgi:hypothetical protein
MRVRKEDADGDSIFGHGQQDFFIDQAEAVAQIVKTRLHLWQGEWFLDTSDGTPWRTRVLGKYTQLSRDMVLRSRVLGTPGVTQIIDYNSTFDGNSRTFFVTMTLRTQFGIIAVQTGTPT